MISVHFSSAAPYISLPSFLRHPFIIRNTAEHLRVGWWLGWWLRWWWGNIFFIFEIIYQRPPLSSGFFFWPQFILSQQPLGGYWVGYLSAYSAVIPYSYISSIMALTRQICVLLRELILNSSFLSFSLAWLTCWLPFEWRALICSDAPSNRNSNSVALEWIFFVSAVYLELKAIIYITHHRNFMASYCQKLSLQNTEYIFFHQVQFCLVFTFPPQLEL